MGGKEIELFVESFVFYRRLIFPTTPPCGRCAVTDSNREGSLHSPLLTFLLVYTLMSAERIFPGPNTFPNSPFSQSCPFRLLSSSTSRSWHHLIVTLRLSLSQNKTIKLLLENKTSFSLICSKKNKGFITKILERHWGRFFPLQEHTILINSPSWGKWTGLRFLFSQKMVSQGFFWSGSARRCALQDGDKQAHWEDSRAVPPAARLASSAVKCSLEWRFTPPNRTTCFAS